jgi:hypothetical protein
MRLRNLTTALPAFLLLVAPALGSDKATELSPAEFKELKPILDLKNQPWTTIPWKYSITEARKLAAASKKPIFMVVNTGNSLSCT